MTESARNRLVLIGCSILRKEILYLIRENHWPVETDFLDSALHIDFPRLRSALDLKLNGYPGRDVFVFYGACHPNMDTILAAARTIRTPGQNCVEMLLGHGRFTRELSRGAFFVLEDWAQKWEEIMTATFGPHAKVMREIIQGDRRYLLCIRTPCSGDYRGRAEEAGKLVGLPLEWTDAGLGNLESVLRETMLMKTGIQP